MQLIDIDASLKLGNPGLPNCGLNNQQCSLIQRFSVCDDKLDSNAFFIAKFRKIEHK